MHVYQTSRVVNNSGSVTDLTVTNPSATQTLTVSPLNALIGWHLVASLDWDASDAELTELVTRFNNASQYLYNATDGQFVIEQVEIADDAQLWGSAEIAFQVDSWVWPHTNAVGGFLGRNGAIDTHIYMSPFSGSTPSGSTDFRTLVHELGHLAMALQDEYSGVNLNGNYCTEARHSGPPGGDFSDGGSRAACIMDRQTQSNKYCSSHNDSAHRSGLWQPGPCWDTIAANYSDPGPSGSFGTGVIFTNRWAVKTPSFRGAVVGSLDPLPSGLQPMIAPPTNKKYHDLCQPFNFVDPAGAGAGGSTVWIRPSFWKGSDFTVGRLDSLGRLSIHGAHMGDTIKTSSSFVIVGPTMCTLTQ